jgi:dipeptidyl aminopeptidase/acylaminoacyl peptidase
LALRAGGHTPEMVIYPREGHSVWEQQHVIHMLRTMEEFLRKHVPQTVEVSSSN